MKNFGFYVKLSPKQFRQERFRDLVRFLVASSLAPEIAMVGDSRAGPSSCLCGFVRDTLAQLLALAGRRARALWARAHPSTRLREGNFGVASPLAIFAPAPKAI